MGQGRLVIMCKHTQHPSTPAHQHTSKQAHARTHATNSKGSTLMRLTNQPQHEPRPTVLVNRLRDTHTSGTSSTPRIFKNHSGQVACFQRRLTFESKQHWDPTGSNTPRPPRIAALRCVQVCPVLLPSIFPGLPWQALLIHLAFSHVVICVLRLPPFCRPTRQIGKALDITQAKTLFPTTRGKEGAIDVRCMPGLPGNETRTKCLPAKSHETSTVQAPSQLP